MLLIATVYLVKLLDCQCIPLPKRKALLLGCSNDFGQWIVVRNDKTEVRAPVMKIVMQKNETELCKSRCLLQENCTTVFYSKFSVSLYCAGFNKFSNVEETRNIPSEYNELYCCSEEKGM
ncbi:unnamed protein product [Schistosoma rodhaini]|nr:unnamed protein product [Schistosoma rodhaini]